MGWSGVDGLAGVEPANFDVGVVFVRGFLNWIVARCGKIPELDCFDAK